MAYQMWYASGVDLNERQKRFVCQYLVDLNASAAALRAGYLSADYGRRLMLLPAVAAEIKKAKAKRSKRVEITADRVVQELARIAFSDPRDFATWGAAGVRLRDSSELTEEQAAALASVSSRTGRDGDSFTFKTHDKLKACDMLLKHLGAADDPEDQADEGQVVRLPLALLGLN